MAQHSEDCFIVDSSFIQTGPLFSNISSYVTTTSKKSSTTTTKSDVTATKGGVFKAADGTTTTKKVEEVVVTTKEVVEVTVNDEWFQLATILMKILLPSSSFSSSSSSSATNTSLSLSTQKRIHHYYLPLYFNLRQQMTTAAKGKVPLRPFCVGLSCPQGGGKTTLVNAFQKLFSFQGFHCCVASLDDFYLTHAKQLELASCHSENKLLRHRGLPGTHDVDLCVRVFNQLLNDDSSFAIPVFEKSLFGGQGDRLPEKQWIQVAKPVDIFILEGWCLGFQSLPSKSVKTHDMIIVNEELKRFAEFTKYLNSLIIIQIESASWVYEWRAEAEMEMRKSGKTALTEAEVKDFISDFMPAYEHYLPQLYDNIKANSPISGPVLNVHIDRQRNVIASCV